MGGGCRAGIGAGRWPVKVGLGRHLELQPGGRVAGGVNQEHALRRSPGG